MKRILLILAGLAVLILVLWMFQRTGKEVTANPSKTGGVVERSSSVRTDVAESTKTRPPSASSSLNRSNDTVAAQNRRAELIRQAGEAKNVPLNFWGRVVDQDDSPLSGTRIELRLRHWTTGYTGSSIPVSMETDTNGLFHAEGASGDVFDIERISKAGYELEPNTRRGFGAAGGSMSEPVIFKMWRADMRQTLVEGTKSLALVPDGRSYSIDIKSGTITEAGSGDITVRIQRPPQILPGEKYEWSSQVVAINGGLLEEVDANSSMFIAPTNGYVASFRFEQKVVSGWGNSTGTKRFYLNMGKGRAYARISLEIWASYNSLTSGRVHISYTMNPSGSRILR